MDKLDTAGKSGRPERGFPLQLYRRTEVRVLRDIHRRGGNSGTTASRALQSHLPEFSPFPRIKDQMNSPEASPPKASLSDYLAAERTLLAWIRTGLALMGFGFVVARFGLFLHQIELVNHEAQAQSFGLSLWFGTALIVVGVLVNILAGYNHIQLVRRLEQGSQTQSHHATAAVVVAFFLAVVGLAMTLYLVTIRG